MRHVGVQRTTPQHGPVFAIGAGVVWSFGAVAARLASDTDAWQYLFWRSVAIIVVVEVVRARSRAGLGLRRAFAGGPLMVGACVALLVASVAFIYALKTTTAANTVFLGSMAPLVAAILGRVLLHESLTRVTFGAVSVAFLGLAVMVAGDVGAGNMVGNVSALFSAVGFASYAVCLRQAPELDWSPVLPGYGAMMVGLCGTVTVFNGRPLFPGADDVGWAVLHGGVIIVVGTLWFNLASRVVPAVAMTVYSQSETVFVPLWIFLQFGERPPATTLVGGAIILAAVVGKAVLEQPSGEQAALPSSAAIASKAPESGP